MSFGHGHGRYGDVLRKEIALRRWKTFKRVVLIIIMICILVGAWYYLTHVR